MTSHHCKGRFRTEKRPRTIANGITWPENRLRTGAELIARLFRGFAAVRGGVAGLSMLPAPVRGALHEPFLGLAEVRGLLLPALERGKVSQELLAVLVGGEVLAGAFVELVDVLHAEVDHLFHGAVLREVAVGVAVLAILGVLALDLLAEGHSAALAEALLVGEWVFHSQ